MFSQTVHCWCGIHSY
nr:unnamed protein product [Callosobruchus analis]